MVPAYRDVMADEAAFAKVTPLLQWLLEGAVERYTADGVEAAPGGGAAVLARARRGDGRLRCPAVTDGGRSDPGVDGGRDDQR